MKTTGALLLLGAMAGSTTAFMPPTAAPAQHRSCLTRMRAEQPDSSNNPSWSQLAAAVPRKLLAPMTLAFATWQGMAGVHLNAPGSGLPLVEPVAQVAQAARPSNAPTSAGSRVNKDAESLLRYGLPIDVKEARELQEAVEGIKDEIRLKRFAEGKRDAQKAKTIINSKKDKLLAAVRPDSKAKAQEVLTQLTAKLDEVAQTFDEDAGRGSEQERAKLDLAYAQQLRASRYVSELEEMMVPVGYKVTVPDEYSNLPQLQGRAQVEMTLKKGQPGEKFEVKGKQYETITVRMVIDGYNAPVTGGNFVDLVNKGFYNNKAITRSDGFVVQYGDPDPEGEVHGYKPPGSSEVRTIPLEIFVKQDADPMYGVTTEDDGRGYSATRLPFQAYGALGMAREEYVADSASSQVFWLLFESDLTPAGKNLLDGRYACFGYTIENAELLAGVKEGDVISSAKVLSGLENLKTK